MEITLQHTNEIYRNFFVGTLIMLIVSSMPAIIQLIKCRYEFAEYKLKYKLLWILPAVLLIIAFSNAGMYMIDYTFDRIDVQTVYIEEIDGSNSNYYLIAGKHKFIVNRKRYTENYEQYVIEKAEDHWCEIESYKTNNNVIRLKILD